MNSKKMESVLALPIQQKYDHFIKKSVGWGEMWSLYDDGWASTEDQNGDMLIPLWPEREYAEHFRVDFWESYTVNSIPLQEALDHMLPYLKDKNILLGIFFSPTYGSITTSYKEFEADLRAEMSKYE